VKADNIITEEIAAKALELLDIDDSGLDEMDKRILETMIEKFGGGPVGISSLAVSVGEEAGTIEELYEPYLIQEGVITRTPQGRVVLPRGFQLFGLAPGGTQQDLL